MHKKREWKYTVVRRNAQVKILQNYSKKFNPPLLRNAFFDLPHIIFEPAKHISIQTQKAETTKLKKNIYKKWMLWLTSQTRGDEMKSANESGFKCFLISTPRGLNKIWLHIIKSYFQQFHSAHRSWLLLTVAAGGGEWRMLPANDSAGNYAVKVEGGGYGGRRGPQLLSPQCNRATWSAVCRVPPAGLWGEAA